MAKLRNNKQQKIPMKIIAMQCRISFCLGSLTRYSATKKPIILWDKEENFVILWLFAGAACY